jgi:hypothetical protein
MRYKPGQHPEYDRQLALFRGKSKVFHNKSHWHDETFMKSSKGGLALLLAEYEGNLERALQLVDMVPLAFEDYKLKRRRNGEPEPETMPEHLLSEQFRLEARADCILEEIDALKELLASHAERERQEKENRVLMNGPMGSIWGEPIIEIDYQPVRYDSEGFPYIDCPTSPYDGMKVIDYREHICKPWRQAKDAAYMKIYEKTKDDSLTEKQRWNLFEKATRVLKDRKGEIVPWPKRPEGM